MQTAGQTVTERTPFERLRVEPTYAYGYGPYDFYDLGWGPFWYPYDVNMGPPSWYW